MIVTVTMNPAVDKTAETAAIVPGGLNRIANITLDAGGKGVNVSKMIAALGGTSVATGFLGGSAGRDIEHVLQGLRVTTDFVPIRDATRTNLKVFSPDFGITEFNEPGAVVTDDEMQRLYDKLSGYAKPGTLFVLSGSLPQGAGADTYRQLASMARANGARVFLDADGEPFRQALEARPAFVKPNAFELAQYFGLADALTPEDLLPHCKRLVETGVECVALSMGAEGALFVSEGMTLRAPGLCVEVRSTVGAGDAMVGAMTYALERRLDFADAAALAMAASAGAVMTAGTNPPDRDTVNRLVAQVKFLREDG